MYFVKFILIHNQSNARISIVLNSLDHSIEISSPLFNLYVYFYYDFWIQVFHCVQKCIVILLAMT